MKSTTEEGGRLNDSVGSDIDGPDLEMMQGCHRFAVPGNWNEPYSVCCRIWCIPFLQLSLVCDEALRFLFLVCLICRAAGAAVAALLGICMLGCIPQRFWRHG